MTSTPTVLRGYLDDQIPYAYGSIVTDMADHVPDCLWPSSNETYRQMRRHPQLAAVLGAYGLPIRRAASMLDPAGCRDEVARLVADDLGLPVAGHDTPTAARVRGVSWSEHLRLALLSQPFGHSGFEMLADIRDGKARLVELSERLPTTIAEIHVDKVGRFNGVTQHMYTGKRVPQVRAEHMVWYAREREGAAWWGQSLLRPAYPAFVLSREMLRVIATGHRRFSVGVPTGEWEPGVMPTGEQHIALQQVMMAARVGETGGMALPPGAHMKLVGLTGTVPDTLGFIKYLDNVMVKMALAGFLDLGTTESGSRALAGDFIDLFLLAIQAEADAIADTATRQAAARIVEWNWGLDEPVPAVRIGDVGAKHEVTAEALNLLLGSGALSADPALEAHIRRKYKLPEREEAAQPAPSVAGDTLTAANPQPAAGQTPTPGEGLVAAAIAASNARNWGSLDEVAAQMAAKEAEASAPAGDPAPHWAAVAGDTGQDWRVDAALARGATVAAAFASVYGGKKPDEDAVLRGYDMLHAEEQATGSPAMTALENFQQQVAAKPALDLTLDLDNRLVAVAVRTGRHSALLGGPVTECPYAGVDHEQAALRRVWLSSYLRTRPPTDGD